MKRILLCLVVACALVAVSAEAWGDPLDSFTLGGFDASRGGMHSIAEGTGYDEIRSHILASFPSVTLSASGTLTSSYLSGVDVVMLASGTSHGSVITPLSATEQAALLVFVQGGGSAVLLLENNTLASGASAAHQSLLDPFGMNVTGTLGGVRALTVTIPAHPVTAGPFGTVGSFTLQYPGWLDDLGPYGSTLATLDTNGYPGLAVIAPDALGAGSGAVVVFTDSNHLHDGYLTAQRSILTRNAIEWGQISGGPSPVPEPTTLALLGLGVAGLALRKRRRS